MDYKDNDIGERIKELRSILKLSQVKFAEAIHISKGYQAQLELMQAPANDRVITLIAATFKVNEAWLRSGEGAMFTRAATPPSTPTEKLERH